jgi:prolyl-tRNA synthetase
LGVGLTHEEAVSDALRDFINSYKDLPVYVYQIGKKFRNELRAKSGLLRGREFIMKDLYSLSRSQEEHEAFYEKISAAYMRIFTQLGIGDITYPTYASGGYFSEFSREFQTISDIGEDT